MTLTQLNITGLWLCSQGPHYHWDDDRASDRPAICPWHDKTCEHVQAVAVDALLSDEAVNAAVEDDGHGAQCCPGIGGCGGVHTDCYYRSKIKAAIEAVTSTGTGGAT